MSTGTTTRKTRADTERKRVWVQPNTLDAPEPPEGYKYRWVRRSRVDDGTDDVQNVLKREREGYEIVREEDLKNRGVEPGDYQRLDSGKQSGAIITGDLILTMVPTEVAEQRTAHFQNRAKRQLDAVHAELMRNQNAKMPISTGTSPARTQFAD